MAQETKKLVSPFPEYPGEIVIPEHLNAAQFNTWHERVQVINADTKDKRHEYFKLWDGRFCFILEHSLQLPEEYELEHSGLKLPDPRLAAWFLTETKYLIEEATDLKNWQGRSENT